MKNSEQVKVLINKKIENHKHTIEKYVNNLQKLKGHQLNDELKMSLVQYASVIAEEKAIIRALGELLKELES